VGPLQRTRLCRGIFGISGSTPRHLVAGYQFLLEGPLLFVLLWLYARKPRKTARFQAHFTGYGASLPSS
jgi:phosphatidylglycerol:prolipoprotein diacylglycerol transferase